MTTKGNTYKQPSVDVVAPDAIIFIESERGMKRTIGMNRISDDGTIVNEEVDIMNFVESISVSKGIDRVPGEASIVFKVPKHAMDENIFGNIKDSLSTMLEIEIYFKGRFLYQNEPQYYPTFWGVISNISANTTAGDLSTITISCQDMMRWLAITKVNVNAAAAYPTIMPEGADTGRGVANGYSTIYAGLSTPGIIRDLLMLSTSEDFFQPKDMSFNGRVIENSRSPFTLNIDSARSYNEQLTTIWREKFKSLGSALFIYGFENVTTAAVNSLQIQDVVLSISAYDKIYDSENGRVRIDVAKTFPYNLEFVEAANPPTFQSDFKSRLDIANEIKNQLHFEFYQDVDGAIILKPPFYNIDVRENPICVIEDIDIVHFNEVEDESSVISRIDVKGEIISGGNFSKNSNANPIYGYAIDFNILQKYGLRDDLIQTNFITNADDAMLYAERELSRRNSLIYNASVSIQGRPELKLGYPVFFPGRNEFYYVTGIEHSFVFGSSFDTSLVLSARRKLRLDNDGNALKNMLSEVFPAANPESVDQGQDVVHDDQNPLKNLARLCDPDSQQFVVKRPNYRWSALDDILKYQGSFRFITDQVKPSGNAAKYQQITDSKGYELVGKYPYGKDLILTEDFRLIIRDNRGSENSEIISGMTLTVSGNERPTLRYQQPISLNQIQNIDVVLQRSKSSVIETMKPNI
jgi:hypothetical protein